MAASSERHSPEGRYNDVTYYWLNPPARPDPPGERFAVPHPEPIPQDVRRKFSYSEHQARGDEFEHVEPEKHAGNQAYRSADNEYRRRDDRVLVGKEELYEEFNTHSFLVYRFHAR